MNLSKLASGLLPALVLGCGVASASTIIVGVDWNRGGALNIRENYVDVQAYFAGVISISVTAGYQTFLRDSLCVDLFTNITVGGQYGTTLLQPSMVPAKNLTRASWLVDNYLLPTQDPAYSSVLDQSAWVRSIAQGQGIQLAIWDIVHDGGNGFSQGSVQANAATDPAALTWAVIYEDASAGMSNNQAFVYSTFDMLNGTPAQMLIGPQFFDGGPQPVPEPETLMPMGIALIALSFGLRRGIRRRQ